MEQESRRRRSDRHQKQNGKQVAANSRSSRHQHKKEKYEDIIQWSKTQIIKMQNWFQQTINRFHKKNKDHLEETNNQNDGNEVKSRSARRKKKRTFELSLKHYLISLGAVFVLALIAYTSILYGGKLFVDEEKLAISPPSTIETEDGEIIWYLYDQYRLPVKLEDIPDHVIDAFIAIEDKRFYEHSGVDFRSIMRAIYRDIITRSKAEGASTITQQLAKNLFLTNEKTWLRKTKEAMIALYLEREFTKDEILEMYLNTIYFGEGMYGIEAAANKYFYKSVEDLTIEEGALLAGIVKAPNSYSPIDHQEKAKERRNLVLRMMSEMEFITEEEAKQLQQKDIELNISQRKQNPAYHAYADLVIKEAAEKYNISLEDLKNNRYKIVTSMNKDAQEIAFDQFRYDAYFPGNNKENVEGAFVMMDQETGGIVAAIGGRSYKFLDFNRVYAKRQPGSTIKPLVVYAPALETKEYTPYSVLPDELREWDGNKVRNHNDQYEGSVTLYDALKRSKNTTAVWLYNELGFDYASSFLKKMNIEIADNGYSVALGGLKHGLTPIQLVEGYRTFIHDGEMIEAHTIKEIYDRKGELIAKAKPKTEQVFSSQVAWNMTEMLIDVVKSGTAQAGSYPHELAGKTGSTQHEIENATKDAWFVGMTPEYVTALWMGYDKSDENHYLTGGSSYPTELTKKILTELDKRQPLATAFTKPDHVQALAEPVELPEINDLESSYIFGGLKFIKGKLEWSGTDDDRVVYHVYQEKKDGDEKIGEVVGENEFIIDKVSIFRKNTYYVVPYDPVANVEGKKSNTVYLTF